MKQNLSKINKNSSGNPHWLRTNNATNQFLKPIQKSRKQNTYETLTGFIGILLVLKNGDEIFLHDEFDNSIIKKEYSYKNIERKEWYFNGMLHKENGPAIEWTNGDKSYYLNDFWYKKEIYEQVVALSHYNQIEYDKIFNKFRIGKVFKLKYYYNESREMIHIFDDLGFDDLHRCFNIGEEFMVLDVKKQPKDLWIKVIVCGREMIGWINACYIEVEPVL